MHMCVHMRVYVLVELLGWKGFKIDTVKEIIIEYYLETLFVQSSKQSDDLW